MTSVNLKDMGVGLELSGSSGLPEELQSLRLQARYGAGPAPHTWCDQARFPARVYE